MDDIIIKIVEEPKLNKPVLIEGLPGVGNVGKLAAEHLIEQLEAKKFADIYSRYFPPQVLVNDDGTIKLVNNELFFLKSKGRKTPDIIFLTGDYQGLTPEGQYKLSSAVLDLAEKYNVQKIFTLGGYGLGRMVEVPRVLGAAGDEKLVEQMKEYGVVFQKGEPGSGIVGASGLLLGLGKIRDIDGICLMGETSGYFADPKSAQEVLKILIKILNIKVDFSELEVKAKQIDKLTSQFREIEQAPVSGEQKPEDLRYIG